MKCMGFNCTSQWILKNVCICVTYTPIKICTSPVTPESSFLVQPTPTSPPPSTRSMLCCDFHHHKVGLSMLCVCRSFICIDEQNPLREHPTICSSAFLGKDIWILAVLSVVHRAPMHTRRQVFWNIRLHFSLVCDEKWQDCSKASRVFNLTSIF